MRKCSCNHVSTAENCWLLIKGALQIFRLWVSGASSSRVLVLLLKLVCLFLLWEVKSISCEKLPSTWRSPMTNVYYSLQRTAQTGSNQSRERSSGPGAQLRKRTRGQLECQRSARLWLRLISLRKATFKGQCQSVDSVFSFHLTTYLMNSSLVFTENVISFGRSKM